MRTVKCHECSSPTPQAAEVCPQCRSPIPGAGADAASAEAFASCGQGLVCALAEALLCGLGALAFVLGGMAHAPWLILMGVAYMLLGLPGVVAALLQRVCPCRNA